MLDDKAIFAHLPVQVLKGDGRQGQSNVCQQEVGPSESGAAQWSVRLRYSLMNLHRTMPPPHTVCEAPYSKAVAASHIGNDVLLMKRAYWWQ